MNRRLLLLAAAVLVLLAILSFPMRLALAIADVEAGGLTARAVRGPVWDGVIEDARLGIAPLGTVRASLAPLPLFAGRTELNFSRDDALNGAISGRLHGGSVRGFSDVTGTATVGALVGMVPVQSVRFDGARLLFDRAGRCVEAGGRATVTIGVPIAGIDLAQGLSGPLQCRKGKAVAALASQSGMERLTLTLGGDRRYVARMAVQVDRDAGLANALSLLGFRAGADGFVMQTSGRF